LHAPPACALAHRGHSTDPALAEFLLKFSHFPTVISPSRRLLHYLAHILDFSPKRSRRTLCRSQAPALAPQLASCLVYWLFFLTLHMHPHIAGPILRTHVSETLRHLLIVYALEPLVCSLTYPNASIGSSAMHRPATPAHEFSRNQCYPILFAFPFQHYTSILTLLTWFPSSRD
jgi:hypothetical protein